LAIKEAAETEMASVLEEVAAHYAAMIEIAATFDPVTLAICEAVTFAVLDVVTIFAFVAVVHFAVVALREAATISAVVFVRVHGWRAVVNVSGRAAISHTRTALGAKARPRSTAAVAKAPTTATTSMCSNASTAAASSTAAVMALRVSAAREDER
jgi:hypothetical protein